MHVRQQIPSHFKLRSRPHHLCHAHASLAFHAINATSSIFIKSVFFNNTHAKCQANAQIKTRIFHFSICLQCVQPILLALCWFLSSLLWLLRNEHASVVTYVCYWLSMPGNCLCDQQPTSPPGSVKNSQWFDASVKYTRNTYGEAPLLCNVRETCHRKAGVTKESHFSHSVVTPAQQWRCQSRQGVTLSAASLPLWVAFTPAGALNRL